MAAKKSSTHRYNDWPDGKWHSIPYARRLQNIAFNTPGAPNLAQIQGTAPYSLPAPPVGTYDPSIDYNAGAAQRGYDQFAGDAQTLFERGQQDYSLNAGDLLTSFNQTVGDLATQRARGVEDYKFRTGENTRQYGILGRRQDESAARQGVTSAGLLAKSDRVRGENQQRDQGQIDQWRDRFMADNATASDRASQAYNRAKLGLDLGRAREFGGFNGQQLLNPLSGQPEFGSLLTSLTRAGAENTSFQSAAGEQRARQAAQMGYSHPLARLLAQLRGGF